MMGHFIAYFGLVFFFLDGWHAVYFIVVQQMLFGLILGSAFAPNHKGMLMVGENEQMDFLRRQVLTARNVQGHPITDMWYGGLNYQIEHHLFPNMPRNNLKEAQIVVKAFCEDHAIPYYETNVAQSVKEILQHLHQESAPLRGGRA
jgi:fatty acid desaturase